MTAERAILLPPEPTAWRATLDSLRATPPRAVVTMRRVVADRRRPDRGYAVEREVRLRE